MATWINPKTGDYLRGEDGRLVADPRAGMVNAIYLRLRTPLGSYWANPHLGSRLHELKKDVPRVQLLAKQYVEAALNDLLISGKINAVDVRVTRPKPGFLLIAGEVTLPVGAFVPFEHFVKVN